MSKLYKNNSNKKHFSLTPIASALCLLLSCASGATMAEQATQKELDAKKEKDIEVIEVTGIVSSLKEAQNIKKFSDNVVDAIVAEDIGKFPDDNVAEALQRVPGISVTRVDGEGQRVTIRGMSGKYNITTFNGRQLATDSNTRDFNYDVIASELVGKIEVHKTQQARLQEGAVGGVVNIYSRKPLDLGKSLSVSVKGDYNERAESFNPKTSIVVSDVFNDGNFGALATFVHNKRTTRYDVYGSTNWDDYEYSELHGDDSILDVLPEGSAMGDVFRMPSWPRITRTESDRERIGGTLALQWLVGDNLDINFDALYSSYNVENSAKAMTLVLPNVWSARGTYTDFNVGPDGLLDSAAWNDATLELLETGVPRSSDTYQIGLNANWIIDEVTLNFDAAVSEASNENDNDGRLVVVRAGIDGAAINFNNGMSIPDMVLSQQIDDTAVYGAHHSRRFGDSTDNSTSRFVVDGTWEPSDGILTALYFGAGYNSQEKDRQYFWPESPSIFALDHIDDVNPSFDAPMVEIGGQTMWQLPSNVINPGTSENFGDGANVPSYWPSINMDNLFGYFEQLDPAAHQKLLPQLNGSRGNTYGVKEETLHAYVEAKFEDELFGLPYMLDVGVRYVQTDIESYGYSQDPANLEFSSDGSLANENWKDRSFVTFGGDYSEVLPSMNFKLNLTDDLVLRLAASKAISRPFLTQLTPNTSLSPELDEGGDGKVTRSMYENDPGLSPYSADQFDTAIEWYYSDTGNLAFATFYKEFVGQIKNETTSEVVAGQDFEVTRPYNDTANPAIMRGYELSWYQTFDEFLPASLEGFGISANYTYNNSESGETNSEGEKIPFFGLSDHQVNLVAFYEIEGFSANIAYNYRSEYTARKVWHWTYETWGSVGTETAMAPSWENLSVGISYDFSENLQFTADAYNLLDPEEHLTVDALKTELLAAGASTGQYTVGSASYGRSFSVGMRYKF